MFGTFNEWVLRSGLGQVTCCRVLYALILVQTVRSVIRHHVRALERAER